MTTTAINIAHICEKKPYNTYYTLWNYIRYPSGYRKSLCKGLLALFIRSNVASKGSSVSELNPLLALRDGRPCTQTNRAIWFSPHKVCPK